MWAQQVPRVSGALGFTEPYDASKEVEGWNLPEYDDSHWNEAHVISRISSDNVPLMDPYPWDNTVPRDIPMLMETEVAPTRVTMIGEVPCSSSEFGSHRIYTCSGRYSATKPTETNGSTMNS